MAVNLKTAVGVNDEIQNALLYFLRLPFGDGLANPEVAYISGRFVGTATELMMHVPPGAERWTALHMLRASYWASLKAFDNRGNQTDEDG